MQFRSAFAFALLRRAVPACTPCRAGAAPNSVWLKNALVDKGLPLRYLSAPTAAARLVVQKPRGAIFFNTDTLSTRAELMGCCEKFSSVVQPLPLRLSFLRRPSMASRSRAPWRSATTLAATTRPSRPVYRPKKTALRRLAPCSVHS